MTTKPTPTVAQPAADEGAASLTSNAEASSLSVDSLVANLKSTIGHLRGRADRLYCGALQDATSKKELLGAAHKVDKGIFGMDELEAHKAHSRQMGQHFAIHDVCNAIEAALLNTPQLDDTK